MSSRPGILITGAARRIGAELAQHFAASGYDIALHYYRSEAEARQLAKALEAKGAQCCLIAQDLSDIAAVPKFMEKAKAALPGCIALVNNASVFESGTLMETDEALFDRQFDVNFKAPFFLTQAFARIFGKGCVVNVLDAHITQASGGHFAYMLSKKALADFTLMAARSLGPGIRVNGVCPGVVLPAGMETPYERKMQTAIPLKSQPPLSELAASVRWLVEQKHVTGQLLFVDGGQHLL